MATVAQTLGAEALVRFVNPSEAIKRLSAAQGIDVLNLVKTPEELQQAKQVAMQDQGQMDLVKQAGQFASSPVMDPQKNPQLGDQAQQVANAILGGGMQQQPPTQQ